MEKKSVYIKTDDNAVINEKYIKWIRKIGDCVEVCMKSNGCSATSPGEKHQICKLYSLDSYNKLNKYFE